MPLTLTLIYTIFVCPIEAKYQWRCNKQVCRVCTSVRLYIPQWVGRSESIEHNPIGRRKSKMSEYTPGPSDKIFSFCLRKKKLLFQKKPNLLCVETIDFPPALPPPTPRKYQSWLSKRIIHLNVRVFTLVSHSISLTRCEHLQWWAGKKRNFLIEGLF